MKKRFYQRRTFWILGAVVAAAGAGMAALSILNPTYFAETAPDHKEEKLRTRRYQRRGDVQQTRREIEAIIPTIQTSIWGGAWKLNTPQPGDSSDSAEIIRVIIPVAVFTDDLRIELKQENGETIVNVRSDSRFDGKGSDLGENRRHVLQILEKLDERFRNAQS